MRSFYANSGEYRKFHAVKASLRVAKFKSAQKESEFENATETAWELLLLLLFLLSLS